MPSSPAPKDPESQLQWLVDRAEISDLIIEFARALDELDSAAYAATYVEDGLFDGPGFSVRGRADLAGAVDSGLTRYTERWHASSNHAITIDGDHATSRSYAFGVHAIDPDDPSRHADLAGWYDAVLTRTDEGWRFVSVSAHLSWAGGEVDQLPGH